MNRMHPEDMRALIAGMHSAHDSLDPIGTADALLAELAETAKPEAKSCHHEKIKATSPTTGCCCHHRAEDCHMLQQRAQTAEARVKELETEVQRQKQCRERSIRLMGAKINRQRTQLNYFHAVGMDLLQARAEKAEAALQTARAKLREVKP